MAEAGTWMQSFDMLQTGIADAIGVALVLLVVAWIKGIEDA